MKHYIYNNGLSAANSAWRSKMIGAERLPTKLPPHCTATSSQKFDQHKQPTEANICMPHDLYYVDAIVALTHASMLLRLCRPYNSSCDINLKQPA